MRQLSQQAGQMAAAVPGGEYRTLGAPGAPFVHLLLALQGKVDLDDILQAFLFELQRHMTVDGLGYRGVQGTPSRTLGRLARYRIVHALTLEDTPLGELTLARRTPFTTTHMELVELLLVPLTQSVSVALRFRQALALARTDALTGLYNRAVMDELLHREVQLVRRHGYPLALLVLDLDEFKAINDRYGHAAGDAVLRRVARVLQGCVRGDDLVFRYAGDEFVIALRQTALGGAHCLARRIATALADAAPSFDGQRVELQASIGCAAAGPDDSAESLFSRADRALYRVKRARARMRTRGVAADSLA